MRLFGMEDPAYVTGPVAGAPAPSVPAPASSGGCTLWPSPAYLAAPTISVATPMVSRPGPAGALPAFPVVLPAPPAGTTPDRKG